ncbi:MAG: NifU family protein [Gemmatimonadaceae bacterium]
MNDVEARALATRVEDQLAALDSALDPSARVVHSAAMDAVGSRVQLYGEGLARMLAIVARLSEPAVANTLAAEFTRDELVGHLLLVHDLHPEPVAVRVQRALDEMHEEHKKQDGRVELVELTATGARLRVVDAGSGCHSTGPELQRAAEAALRDAAPELMRIDTEIASVEAPAVLVPLVHRRMDTMQAMETTA